jgi:protein-disulfide isomerase
MIALITLIFLRPCYANQTKLRPVSAQSDYIYGAKNAPVSIIMYSDSSCPYCKKSRLSLKKLVNNSSGEINWVYRHFLLEGNLFGSMRQAQAIQCAGKISGNDGFLGFNSQLIQLAIKINQQH